MGERISVAIVDADEDDRTAQRSAKQLTRAQFVRRAAVGGGVLAAGGIVITGLPRLAGAQAPSAAQDVRILNFLLLAEYLQAAFYRNALGGGQLTGEFLEFAETVSEHEQAHVAYLKDVLGAKARPQPSFTFSPDSRSGDGFGRAALVLEETGSGAYIGQGANLTRGNILAAARVASVEARHAAWRRDILGRLPAPAAADKAKSQKQVLARLRSAGFID
jgi:hypothetical protein